MSQNRQDEIARLVAELTEMGLEAPERLGKRVASLTIREQAELALRLPARFRLELLLHAPRPMRLVRSLPDYEFYLTVREVGPTDALPLVALGSAAQLQHLLDLESWRRDRFDAERAGAWVALLVEAGEPAIRRFLRSADDAQIVLLFRSWLRVSPIVPEDEQGKNGQGFTEPGDAHGIVSPDGGYRFSPSFKEHAPVAQRIARIFFLEQRGRYHELLWAALHELPAEIEEEALRWRQSRLEERGFPPWDEAIHVYAPPVGVRSHPQPPTPTDPDGLAAPISLLDLPALRTRLGAAIEQLDEAASDRVLHEFFGLSNHLLIADGDDTGDPSAHRAALEKAAGYVGIALTARGVEGARPTAETFAAVPLIELFREGYAQAVELQQRARALRHGGWAATHPRAFELLDTPIRERLGALLEPRPLYLEVANEEVLGEARPFRSVGDLGETRVALEVAEVVGQLLVERLGLDVSRALDRERPERVEPPRFSTFVLTFLAWHAARGELRGDPLPDDVLSDFLRTVASRRTADRDAPTRSLEAWIHELRAACGLDAKATAVLGAFGRACLEQLAAECGSLDPGVPVDPRYVACLLIGD